MKNKKPWLLDPLPQRMTFAEKYRYAMTITDPAEAKSYFEKCVRQQMLNTGKPKAEAEKIERDNLGYYAGYYDSVTVQRVERLYNAAHPIFGMGYSKTKEQRQLASLVTD